MIFGIRVFGEQKIMPLKNLNLIRTVLAFICIHRMSGPLLSCGLKWNFSGNTMILLMWRYWVLRGPCMELARLDWMKDSLP